MCEILIIKMSKILNLLFATCIIWLYSLKSRECGRKCVIFVKPKYKKKLRSRVLYCIITFARITFLLFHKLFYTPATHFVLNLAETGNTNMFTHMYADQFELLLHNQLNKFLIVSLLFLVFFRNVLSSVLQQILS